MNSEERRSHRRELFRLSRERETTEDTELFVFANISTRLFYKV